MVSALSRDLPQVSGPNNIRKENNCRTSNELPPNKNKYPCALREFINSNADLPTIDELVKKSKQLAMAMGMLD